MAKQPSGRGSLKLGKAAAAIKDSLKSSKILDWHQLGTPNPELIIGTVQTDLGNFKKKFGYVDKTEGVARPEHSDPRHAAA
jgi:hypothetical protein